MDTSNNYLLLLMFAFLFLYSHSEEVQESFCKCHGTVTTCRRMKWIPSRYKFCKKTETLDLSSNYLDSITVNEFNFTGAKHVKTIYLNGSTIKDLDKNAFAHFTQLEFLDLSDNLLETVPASLVVNNTKLTHLSLSMNYFHNDKTPTLISRSLEVLDLSQAGIEFFDETSVLNLPNLKYLYLDVNHIHYINPSTFVLLPKLVHVELSHNPWWCNCSTAKMFDYLIDKKLLKVEGTIRCRQAGKKFEDMYSKEGAVYSKKACKGFNAKAENEKIEILSGTKTVSTPKSTLLEQSTENVILKSTQTTQNPTTKKFKLPQTKVEMESKNINYASTKLEPKLSHVEPQPTNMQSQIIFPENKSSRIKLAIISGVVSMLLVVTVVGLIKVPPILLKHRKRKLLYTPMELEL